MDEHGDDVAPDEPANATASTPPVEAADRPAEDAQVADPWEEDEAPVAQRPRAPLLNFRSTLRQTLDLFLSHPVAFVPLVLPQVLLGVLLNQFLSGVDNRSLTILIAYATTTITMVLGVGTILAADDARSGRPIALSSVASRALRIAPRAFGLAILLFAGIFGLFLVVAFIAEILAISGSGPLIVASFLLVFVVIGYAYLRWSLAIAAVALTRRGPMDALGRSLFLTRGNVWRLVGLFLPLGVIVTPLTIGMSLLATGDGVLPTAVGAVVAGVVSTPLYGIGLAVAFGETSGRPVMSPASLASPRIRGVYAGTLLVVGLIALGASVPNIGPIVDRAMFPGVPAADRGVILFGTSRDEANRCHPTGSKTTFSSSESIYIGGYFTTAIPRGQSALLSVYANGVLASSGPLIASSGAVGCYYEQNAVRGASPGTYRLAVTFAGATIAEGTFTIR